MSPLPRYATPGSPETALVQIQHRPGHPTQLVLSPNLRISGLLRVLPPELLQVFVALLTFQGAMGEIRAVVDSLAESLGLHPEQVQQRLELLSTYMFDEAPLVFSSAEHTYSLSKRVGVPVEVTPHAVTPEPAYQPASREAIIEHSRERYATPRAEAERVVAEQLGIMPEEPIPEGREGDAYRALLAVGIPDPDARQLLAECPIESIEQQLEWLPRRGARNPARFLLAAIRGDYASPDVPRP